MARTAPQGRMRRTGPGDGSIPAAQTLERRARTKALTPFDPSPALPDRDGLAAESIDKPDPWSIIPTNKGERS